jgi:hypothetical protein
MQHVDELRRPLVARTDLLFQRLQDQSIPADAKRLRARIDPLDSRQAGRQGHVSRHNRAAAHEKEFFTPVNCHLYSFT